LKPFKYGIGLNLSENFFGVDDASIITHYFKGKHSVSNLDLSKNPLKDEGVSILSSLLKTNSSLKYLNLSDT